MTDSPCVLGVRFAAVPDWPGYVAGDDGSIWSQLSGEWRRLKLSPNKRGYLYVTLCRDGQQQRFQVHTLVLRSFVGECPPGMQARHWPSGDPADNRLSNLSWTTPGRNGQDRVVHGTQIRGEDCHLSVLAASQVVEILVLLKQGVPHGEIAARFRVTYRTIGDIAAGKTWKEIPRGDFVYKSRKPKTLRPADVAEILEDLSRGADPGVIAAARGVTRKTIVRIARNEIWKSVPRKAVAAA